MKEVVLLPFGDQSHIDTLLERLGTMVEEGREGEFAMLLPSAQLLHGYRQRLVRTASRQIHLTTFDELVAAALTSTGTDVSKITGTMVTEIMAYILTTRANDLPMLGGYADSRNMARELAYALGQMRRANISPGELETALAESLDPVLADVLTVWRDYQTFLTAEKLADIEEQYVRAARSLAAIPWLREIREFHVCWFFDFEPLQQEILDKLADTMDVTVWLPYMHPAHTQYIGETLQVLQQRGFAVRSETGLTTPLTANLFTTPSQPSPAPRVQGLAAPRIKQELELIAREVKKCAAQGATLQDICLVVPDQQRYLPPLRRLYREHGIELAMPLITDLTAVPWVREVLALWRAAAAGWDRESLLPLVGSAYFTAHLPDDYDPDAVAHALISLGGNPRGSAWLTRVDQEIQRLTRQLAAVEERWLQKGIEQLLNLYKAAQAGIQAWVKGMGAKFKALTPQGHCQLLQELLEANAPLISREGCGEWDTRDNIALVKIRAAIQDYLSCCKLLKRTAPISPGQFVDGFSPWLEQDLSLERSNPGAVQVFSPTQVRGLQYKYVFVLGLNQGTFPRPHREHWLLDRLAGLPGLDEVARKDLAQQKIFFHSCVTAVQDCLYLSRLLPGVEGEEEISPFWQEVETLVEGGLPQETLGSSDILPPMQAETITAPGQLRQSVAHHLAQGGKISEPLLSWFRGQGDYGDLYNASQVEQRREGPQPADNMDGVLQQSSDVLEATWGRAVYSISRLEQYIRCPFSFFARYCLGLDPAPGDVPEYSALDKGSLLHWLLEKFYRHHLEQADVNNPKTILDPLVALAEEWVSQQGRDPELILWRLRIEDVVSTAKALIEVDLPWLKRTGFRPVLLEGTFGLPGSPVKAVQPGGGPVSFHGKIDRIDVLEHNGETWAVVYDYKSSREITIKDIVSGNSLQILVYIAAAPSLLATMGYTNVRVMGGGYYIFRTAKLAGGIWDKEFTTWAKKRLGALESEEFQNLEHGLAARVQELHQQIMAGNFAPDPDANVCRYCDYLRLCRYDKNRFNLKKGVK